MLWGYPISNVQLRVQGEVFVTETQAHVLLLEPTQKPNIGNNLLLNLDPKLEPWKNKGMFCK
jgi:hypothetical protein